MTQIMIDIETLSTKTNAAIVSIGAVAFDFNTGISNEYYVTIDLGDAIKNGHVCGYSLKYWLKQSDNARKELLLGSPFYESLNDFACWIEIIEPSFIWANSPSFDLVIIKNAFEKLSVKEVWKFSKERDYRTYLHTAEMFGFAREYLPITASHNSLEDARNQANELIRAHQYLFELKNKADDKDLITIFEKDSK